VHPLLTKLGLGVSSNLVAQVPLWVLILTQPISTVRPKLLRKVFPSQVAGNEAPQASVQALYDISSEEPKQDDPRVSAKSFCANVLEKCHLPKVVGDPSHSRSRPKLKTPVQDTPDIEREPCEAEYVSRWWHRELVLPVTAYYLMWILRRGAPPSLRACSTDLPRGHL
jgi:hypothetical protein